VQVFFEAASKAPIFLSSRHLDWIRQTSDVLHEVARKNVNFDHTFAFCAKLAVIADEPFFKDNH